MKKIIVLLLLLVFVFGCGTGGDGSSWFGGGGEKTPAHYGFGSTAGLSVTFAEDTPPKEIVRNKPLKFVLNVRNNGIFTIPSGSFVVRLVGLDNNFNPSEIEARNSDLLNQVDESGIGGEANVDLGSTSYNPEQMFDDRVIKSGDVEAEFCYPYQTRVVSDNFLIGKKTSDVSKGTIASGDNSNSPVHVLELEEKGSGDSTDFNFKIKVVGKGSVVSTCFPSTDEDKKKNVELKVLQRDASCYYEDGGEKREIGTGGTVVLNNLNEKIVHCTIPFTEEKPVKSQLQLQLDYLYLDKVSVPGITITRV
jgi:hypothetical protein